jgi:hypothetical protein
VLAVGLEGAAEDFAILLHAQIGCGTKSEIEPGFMKSAAGVLLELANQRGNQVEGNVNTWKFPEQLHHSPIVFQRVQARPWQHESAGNRIAVFRLMHVPDQDKVNSIHMAVPAGAGHARMLE